MNEIRAFKLQNQIILQKYPNTLAYMRFFS